jgi:hypothetical protein
VGIVVGSVVGNIIKSLLALAAVIVFVLTTWSTLSDLQTVAFNFPDIDWSFIDQGKHFVQDMTHRLGDLRLNNPS